MSLQTGEERRQQRITDLYATDPQFAAARPDPAVGEAVDRDGNRLSDIVRIVMDTYADRPALGRRAVDYVTDAAGRTSAELLPRFDTITYRQTWERVRAVATALAANVVQPGDRVAVLGFTSVDYTVIDIALNYLGAVSVPLQTSAPVASLRPILAETEPVLIFSSVDFLTDAVELARTGSTPRRVVVFDDDPRVDADREAVEAASATLSDAGVGVETLAAVVERGAGLPVAPPHVSADPDPLMLLIYTSGSTGTPKGAMYPERLVVNSWRASARAAWGQQTVTPSIILSFMPMSHMMGRGILYASLATGGTVYFAARSDLSTFLEDVALVRPTHLNFVPRIWEMIFQEAQSGGAHRDDLIGGRGVAAMTGSAPISPELKAWVEDFIDLPLTEGYGSTEAGAVFVDGIVRRPPVREYKLVDVPELGYHRTDRPFPRGELLVKSDDLIPGYYRRPEITAEVFDEDGFYKTGDIVAETGPDQLHYLDRRNNVLKLSQGEFVTVSKLEAAFGASPLVRQIYVYGNSARSYLLAVIVPTQDALDRTGGDAEALHTALSEALLAMAREAELQSYEIPRDFVVETEPFTLENGLLTGIRKLARPKLKEHYGPRLEELYVSLAEGQASELRAVRAGAADGPVLETVGRAAAALLGATRADVRPDAQFTDLGGDSLSALTFGNLLHDVFDVEVPVGVIVSPANDLAAIAAYIEAQRSATGKRPTYDSVHGRNATEVHARDLTLDKFIDAETLRTATTLPAPGSEVRTVLLTGATGFLGRYLALDWLERMSLVGGTVICLVRARDDAAARQRLDATFDSGDPFLLEHYRELSPNLEVLAGDKGEADLGLAPHVWQRLAETVDLIVDPAALVNHVLPYRELFGPNGLGTAELLRLALTTKLKPFTYVSTIGVGAGITPGQFTEDGDIREISATRKVDGTYANGYGNSKWAGEVLLREAHDLCGLPVAVFRCDMILADTTYAGQLNLPDMFTRTILSVVATGVAPESFYELDAEGRRQRAHYDGLPVEFIADAISTLGAQAVAESGDGFATYHVMNPYDDGIGLDEFVDWLVEAGYRIDRVAGYDAWLERFETAVRALPERQRQYSLLPLLHNYQRPDRPINGAMAPTDRFRAAVQDAKLGPDKDIPHITAPVIVKYASDLELLGLL